MKHMKSSTKLTIFTTLLIMTVIFVLYMLLISEVDIALAEQGINLVINFISPRILALFIFTAVLAYFIGSVIIDRILNPVRVMISKVREIGSAKFIKPLAIDSDDDELREYAAAFNDMSRKLNSYVERQSRFISDAAHELSTPITAINGHADLLLRWGKEHPDILESGLQTIKTEAVRMSGLIDSLLLLARSDNGRQAYNFQRVIITDLIKESVKESGIIAPDFNFELSVEDGICVRCDEYALLRVLRIILSNAIKYSEDSREIYVRAYEMGGLAYISVRDKGVGISPEHLQRIFERFYRADDSRSKKTGSSGLGLSIAEEIINAHGGNIQVSSIEGEGSVFTVVLPL